MLVVMRSKGSIILLSYLRTPVMIFVHFMPLSFIKRQHLHERLPHKNIKNKERIVP